MRYREPGMPFHFQPNMRTFCLTALLAILSGCAGTSRWTSQIDWKEFTLAEIPTAADYPNLPAVILLDEGELEVFNNLGYSTIRRRTIIKILNRGGHKFANVTIPYSAETEVTAIQARTIDPAGKITGLDPKDIFDVNLYPEFMLFSDVRAKIFTLPAVDVGSILEYTFTKRFSSRNYSSSWVFQQEIPTRISRYSLKIPQGWEYQVQNYLNDVKPRKENAATANTLHYVWEARDIPEFLVEPNMPPLSRSQQRIEFSPAFVKTWQDIGNWYWQLANDRMAPTTALKSFTERLLVGATTEREKLERIFNFVQEKIRYVAVSIGIGNYQPHFAGDIFHKRYGDCKDMSALMVAMARAAGIAAAPVLISTHYNGAVDTLLVSQSQFNHAITTARLADGQLFWLDATDKHTPFGELPWYDQNQLALVIYAADSAVFARTPANPGSANQIRRDWELALAAAGRLAGAVKIQYTGAPAAARRRTLEMLHPKINEQFLASELGEICPGARLDSFKIENLAEIQQPLQIYLYFEAPNFAAVSDSGLVLPAALFAQTDYSNFFPGTSRKHPIELKFLERKLDFISLKLAPELEISFIPRNQFFQTDFGEYELRVVAGTTLQIFRQFQTKTREIIVPDYAGWKAFLAQVSRGDRAPVFLNIQKPKKNMAE
jgi:transglutaminase-like putative cysteine protease